MTTTTNAILACVDGSYYTDSVCAHAAWAAQRLQAPVQILHVQPTHNDYAAPRNLSGAIGLGEKSALLEKLTQVDEERGRLDQQKGKLILEHAKTELTNAGIGGELTPITTLHRRGSLVETIAELDEHTQLILLGKRGEQADFATLHLGSNLERVVRSAQKPVMVAARGFNPINRFVIAYDGGSSTRKALAYLVQSPLLRGLECHLLKVGADNADNRAQLADAERALQQAHFTVHTSLRQGNVDEVLANYVKNEAIELLVMGAYGHTHIRTLIIGSTTSNMLRSCLVPVLMFR